MCLITIQKEPLIAKEDMIVYKLLNKDYSSPYQLMNYTLEQLYTTQLQESNQWMCFDTTDEKYLDITFPGWRDGTAYERAEVKKNLVCIAMGFHAALTKERLKEASTNEYVDYLIVPCTVPKGSEYYLDATDLIVSNQIIVHKHYI